MQIVEVLSAAHAANVRYINRLKFSQKFADKVVRFD